ncbi:cell division protein FtsA [Altererythrobacter sp. SALINAS58]|uniref:cell division protein FtsA n=1 Tax=Alteripontixanthobacter muriae TaxID=2705546 RepID=UPI0015753F5A|nr:cell division protein FtsA [Alteripontixanthobacter muriae]NTZ42181.1 cell division protein FtsA [Alteripontixanthobacter muriae]
MGTPRISRVFGAVNIGSFRISAMIMGVSETGDLVVLGSGHRASEGIKRGYVTDMAAATHAIRDAVERAERNAGTSISSVWVGCSGAGLASQIAKVEVDIGGRRIEEEDIEHLLLAARDNIQPDGREVLHAQPAHYTLDGVHGVASPKGLHAERLGVDIHVMLADGAPVRNLLEAVQSAHLGVEAVVAAPIATGHACLTPEERELGVALIEIGGEVTNVSVHAGGMLLGLTAIPTGSGDITDAIASAFGIRRSQAERLKCVAGSAIASPTDHREMVSVNGPGDGQPGDANAMARGADDANRIPRAELVSVVTQQLSGLTDQIGRSLKAMGFTGAKGGQVVLTGGGAELAGFAEFAQGALGRPVRIGRPPALRGLPEAHSAPGFSTLAGLCLYASEDPVDIRTLGDRDTQTTRYTGMKLIGRVARAVREYF